MQSIDFEPSKRTIEDLLTGPDLYVIPRFQRPYSWDASNLDDFWRDVVFDNGVGYFIGPMVAWRESDGPIRRVVDGQQRLTTISIILAVIRDEFNRLGEAALADGIHRYLEKADRNNELHFTLAAETPSAFLSQAILRNPPERSVAPITEEELAHQKALEAIEKRVTEETEKRRSEATKWLKKLRDLLLGLRVIWIEHGNEDDAYVIFETLNSRGKDLEVADLLKNHLLNRLRGTGNSSADAARGKWELMRSALEASDSQRRIDPNRFILHWWLSQHDYVAERKLFIAIKSRIKTKPLAKAALESLADDAVSYRAVVEPSSRSWPIEEQPAKRALRALEIFGVTQPAPLLLSLMRSRESSPKLGASHFNKTLQTIERFHFQHTVVSQLRSSGGVSEMYAKTARELYTAGDDNQKRASVLASLRKKLLDRQPDREQFVLSFLDRFHFSDSYTRDSKLVRYVLETLLRHAQPSTGTDNLTIEHIMPQSAMKEGQSFDTVAGLGNLLLVSESVNGALGSRAFPAKRKVLAEEGATYDIGGILDQQTWTTAEIKDRARTLAERAYDEVWKLPV